MSIKDVFALSKKKPCDNNFEFGKFYKVKLIDSSIYIQDENTIDSLVSFNADDFVIIDKKSDYPRKNEIERLFLSCIYLGEVKGYKVLRGVCCLSNNGKTNDTQYCYFAKNINGKQHVIYYKIFDKVKYKLIENNFTDEAWTNTMLDIATIFMKSHDLTNSKYFNYYFDFHVLNYLGL